MQLNDTRFVKAFTDSNLYYIIKWLRHIKHVRHSINILSFLYYDFHCLNFRDLICTIALMATYIFHGIKEIFRVY